MRELLWQPLRQMGRDAWDFLVAGSGPGLETARSHSWPWPPSVTVLLLSLTATGASLIAETLIAIVSVSVNEPPPVLPRSLVVTVNTSLPAKLAVPW